MSVQNKVIEALLKPEAYPQDPGKIDLIQTHISFVFLVENYVYKVKKNVNFGFLDFSTLEKRYIFCKKELKINRRLCPELYLKVVPINKSSIIKINGDGETVEYALKMKRLPQEKIMTILLKEDKVNKKNVDEIAEILSYFHTKAKTNNKISKFGSPKIIKINWDENFAQTTKYINQTITQPIFQFIQSKINDFIQQSHDLFESRIVNKHIRECHGDLHSGNIFLAEKIFIFDAIEFNDRFRFSDVAADVAFLAMDLDFQQRSDLSNYFIERYVAYSRDRQLKQLLSFYKCYRAYVRGKVTSFKLDDPNISPEEKLPTIKEAHAYFNLAAEYSKTL